MVNKRLLLRELHSSGQIYTLKRFVCNCIAMKLVVFLFLRAHKYHTVFKSGDIFAALLIFYNDFKAAS